MMIDVQWDHVRLVLWEVWDRQWLQQTNKHLIKWRGIKNVTVSFRVASVHLAVSVAIDPPRLPPFSVIKVQASESVFLSEYKKHGKENTRHVRSSDCGLSLKHKGFWDPGPCQTDYDTFPRPFRPFVFFQMAEWRKSTTWWTILSSGRGKRRFTSFVFVCTFSFPSLQVQVLSSLIKINRKHEKWANLLLYSTFLIYVLVQETATRANRSHMTVFFSLCFYRPTDLLSSTFNISNHYTRSYKVRVFVIFKYIYLYIYILLKSV